MSVNAAPSIRRRLLQNMVLPVAVLAIVFGIGGAFLIHSVVSLTQDRLLDAALVSIIDRATARGPAHLDNTVAQGAIEILGDEANDTFAFCISDGAGFQRGDPALCALDTGPAPLDRITHEPADLSGNPVRIAMTSHTIEGSARPLTFRMAETLNSRLDMEARMVLVLVFFEAVLLSTAAILSYLAILRGLLPLTEISQELLGRATPGAIPFTHIDTARVPEEAVDLVSAINTLMELLDETNAGVRDFTADASHQLRSPLSGIRLHLELLERQAVGQDNLLATLAEAQSGVKRLQRVLQQLIVLARVDPQSRAIDLDQSVDLGRLAADVLGEHAPKALKRDVDIALDAPNEPINVVGDPLLLKEIIANLVDNAIAHSPERGCVTVRVMQDTTTGIIAVDDEGPGIPKEERSRVFQRFYQIARSDAKPGSGLGLAIARRIADLHDGLITLGETASGHGLSARLSLRLFQSKSLGPVNEHN
ncbi:ATP-binding protein [Rhizobium calliandrae]|uniref:histidine kinase n=1 Tax=Rhizobium calliandrae TaxID=1312182 RepID=A0ABT7KI07_9HYPH|nr:ATP-binding protein [Rhizobium calliandrae]MDL2407583.1 ATP-binding protein [Rhizobium calliandrae]